VKKVDVEKAQRQIKRYVPQVNDFDKNFNDYIIHLRDVICIFVKDIPAPRYVCSRTQAPAAMAQCVVEYPPCF
jgi:hypothetical protein